MSAQLHIEITTPIATVRTNGPGPRHRLDAETWRGLVAIFDGLRERTDVACVVVRGTGSGAFACGPDGAPRAPRLEQARAAALRAIQRCEHPTVAIIEGLCVGEGLEIAACCDLRICGASSRFGAPSALPERNPSSAVLDPVTRLVGRGPVHSLLMAGELIGAERALGIGLVSRVDSDLAVTERGYGLAARIAAGAPLVNRWHKRFLHRLLDPTPVTEDERDEAYAALARADFAQSRSGMPFVEGAERRFGIN